MKLQSVGYNCPDVYLDWLTRIQAENRYWFSRAAIGQLCKNPLQSKGWLSISVRHVISSVQGGAYFLSR